MNLNLKTSLAAAALGVAAVLTVAGAASATPSPTNPANADATTGPTPPSSPVTSGALKAKCDSAIAARLAEITKLEGRIATASTKGHLTSSDATGLLALFQGSNGATAGLQALQTKIDQPGGDPTLKADCETIYGGFRIFALRSPQVHLVIAVDDENHRVTVLDKVAGDLTKLVNNSGGAGIDLDGAKAALKDMTSHLADATSQLATVSTMTVIGDTPQQWNANHALLVPSVTAAKAAHADLKTAAADAHKVLVDLGH